MTITFIAALKKYADDPKNKNPDETRQQVKQFAAQAFKFAYGSDDYQNFAPTSKGIVKVR